MDYHRLKKYTLIGNVLSGNFYPLDAEKKKLGLGFKIYALLTWVVLAICVASVWIGAVYFVPPLKAFQECAAPTTLVSEVLILSIHFNWRREHLNDLQIMFDRILVDNDALKRCLIDTVEPHKLSLNIYLTSAVGTSVAWGLLPLLRILETDIFTYADLIVPAWIPGGEPFTVGTYLWGIIFLSAGGYYLTLKKVSIDLFIIYFAIVLTSEYTYVREQLALALRRDAVRDENELSVITELQKCVKHHAAVIETSQLFVDLVALNVGVAYLISIVRFCVTGYGFIAFGDDYWKKSLYMSYGAGIVIQLYMLCSCVQSLLEASTSVTDDAFHEDWHGRGGDIKKIFSTIELTKHMDCRLSAWGIIDMTTPTLAAILNQSYSACLLLLRMK